MATAPISWYRTPIDRDKLRELATRSDWKGLVHAGGFLTIYAVSVALNTWLYLQQLWVPLFIGCYLHSMFASFMGIEAAVHELSHGTVFKTKWLNAFSYRLFAFLTWNSYVHFKESHTRHHQLTYFRNLDREQQSDPVAVRWYDVVSWFTFDFKKFRKHVWTNINRASLPGYVTWPGFVASSRRIPRTGTRPSSPRARRLRRTGSVRRSVRRGVTNAHTLSFSSNQQAP